MNSNNNFIVLGWLAKYAGGVAGPHGKIVSPFSPKLSTGWGFSPQSSRRLLRLASSSRNHFKLERRLTSPPSHRRAAAARAGALPEALGHA
jgi:hypothetical protein